MEPTVQNTGGSPAVEGELTAIPILASTSPNVFSRAPSPPKGSPSRSQLRQKDNGIMMQELIHRLLAKNAEQDARNAAVRTSRGTGGKVDAIGDNGD